MALVFYLRRRPAVNKNRRPRPTTVYRLLDAARTMQPSRNCAMQLLYAREKSCVAKRVRYWRDTEGERESESTSQPKVAELVERNAVDHARYTPAHTSVIRQRDNKFRTRRVISDGARHEHGRRRVSPRLTANNFSATHNSRSNGPRAITLMTSGARR